jgi:ribosome maturation factor RimP
MATMSQRIETFARSVTTDLDLDLYDFEFTGGVIKITIDKPGGVDLSHITEVTRMVSRELDVIDPVDGAYSLEVSSPGLERLLRRPDHFTRIIGWEVSVKTKAFVEGDRRVRGILVAADETGCTLRLDNLSDRTISYDDIEKARTVFDWGPRPKPGSPEAKRFKQRQEALIASGAVTIPGIVSFADPMDTELGGDGDDFDDDEFDEQDDDLTDEDDLTDDEDEFDDELDDDQEDDDEH